MNFISISPVPITAHDGLCSGRVKFLWQLRQLVACRSGHIRSICGIAATLAAPNRRSGYPRAAWMRIIGACCGAFVSSY
jgi:hypothetical protein